MAVEPAAVEQRGVEPALERKPATGARKWLAFGTGVAIEIGARDLYVSALRLRPSGAAPLGELTIENFRERPATEWGAEYAAFAKQAGAARVPATVLLPRTDVVVRQIALPGVAAADLESAVALQLDTLHPWPEDDVVHGWAALDARPGQPSAVLVGVARRETIDAYANLFSEAGLRMARFTFSAAALYAVSRLVLAPPEGFLAVHEYDGACEFYGESDSRPVLSSRWEGDSGRGAALALSELRLGAGAPVVPAAALLPPGLNDTPHPIAAAAAAMSAGARVPADANLLPEDRRTQSSRMVYLPTAVLGLALLLAAAALFLQPAYHERQYLLELQSQIRGLEGRAAEAARLDRRAAEAREHIALIDRYRKRAKADADALREVTNLLAPPAWIQSFQLSRTDLNIQGEAEQATALLKLFDESPLFKDSSFSQTMMRSATGEQFVIRAQREGEGTGLEKGESR
ncbi:MAG: pilus assembly protein PilM [Bryobacteraceae bacterium]